MRANVYVDGLNLYYAALKGTPYKWLDVRKLAKLLLPRDQIHRIRYFTALPVYTQYEQQSKAQRVQAYLRALQTLRGLSVHYGSSRVDRERLLTSVRDAEYESVLVRREKGSDVNLASLLLVDGVRADYEVAVVLSNDSDLALPIRLVRTRLQLPVGVLKPGKWFANELVRAATFYKPIREGVLAASQLPPQLTDEHGTITKPGAW